MNIFKTIIIQTAGSEKVSKHFLINNCPNYYLSILVL
jgi:hypothetical protein